MRILISNDDGIYSPGIPALAKAAARFGDVRIVAKIKEKEKGGPGGMPSLAGTFLPGCIMTARAAAQKA